MAPWVSPRRLSLMFSACTTATGMPTTRAAESTRLKSASTPMTDRNTGRSRRMKRQLSARSRLTVDNTPPSAARRRLTMEEAWPSFQRPLQSTAMRKPFFSR